MEAPIVELSVPVLTLEDIHKNGKVLLSLVVALWW